MVPSMVRNHMSANVETNHKIIQYIIKLYRFQFISRIYYIYSISQYIIMSKNLRFIFHVYFKVTLINFRQFYSMHFISICASPVLANYFLLPTCCAHCIFRASQSSPAKSLSFDKQAKSSANRQEIALCASTQ